MIRCSCLTTIIRNLSFVEDNEFLANNRWLLDTLVRILNCHHQDMHKSFDCESYLCQQDINKFTNCSNLINSDDKQLESSTDSISPVCFLYSTYTNN